LKFKELEIFYKLSENPHMSSVAKELHMSQSAVSLSIKSLEKKLEEKLFDRVGKRLVLNERGVEFKKSTYKEFVSLKNAENLFKKDKIRGVLSICGSRTIGDYILPQAVFDFRKRYPQVSIDSSVDNSQNIVDKVANAELNMGFIEANIYHKELCMEKLAEDEMVVVTKDKNLTKRDYFVDELFDKVWLIREEGSGTRDMFFDTLGELSKSIDNILELTSFESIKTILLENKEAITCISKMCVKNEIKRGELFEVRLKNISFKRDFFVIYRKNRYKTLLFSTFKSFSKGYFIDT